MGLACASAFEYDRGVEFGWSEYLKRRMQMVVTGWFGWSVLWLFPLLWRLSKTFLFKKAPLQGHGSIRLWLGTLLVLGTSSALEAFIRSDGSTPNDSVVIGQLIAVTITNTFGMAFGILLLLTTAALTLPWLFGRSTLPFAAWCYRACVGLLKGREQLDDKTPARYPSEETSFTRSNRISQRTAGSEQPKTAEPWKLPAPYFGKESLRKAADATPAEHEKTPSARPSEEWAPFESIRPTSAMLARANAVQAASARKTQAATVKIVVSPQHSASFGNKALDRKPEGTKVSAPYRAPVAAPHPNRQNHASSLTNTEPASPDALQNASPIAPQIAVAPNEVTRHPAATNTSAAAIIEASVEHIQPELIMPVPAEVQAGNQILPRPSMDNAAPFDGESSVTEISAPFLHDLMMPPQKLDEPVASPSTLLQAEQPIPIAPSAIAVSRPSAAPSELFEFQAPYEISVDLPGLDLLDMPSDVAIAVSDNALEETGRLIEQRLKEFKVPVTVLGACAGPVITRFEIEPAVGVRGAQIVGLMKDLSRALGLTSIRVVETIPGKTCMGLELPNRQRQMIRLSEMLKSDAYRASHSQLTLAMGKDITGTPVVTDLARAPHMLVAGTTGSGKSVAINAMILSLLYKSTPADVRLIMIDPKMLELSIYDGIPHLLAPVVTDMKHAANALSWCVSEMDKRYRLMSAVGVRNLAGFNQKIRDGRAAEKYVTNPFSLTPDAPEPLSTLPLIVVVIDELADLMMVTGKKIEELIARLAQKARAAGIHLILATQRPSVDVITGLIKANIPTRVAFQVSSKIDSRTVLDQMGAETLLGNGDMLFLPPGSGYPQRVHGAFVSDEEVHRVVEYLKQFGEPEYEEAILAGTPSDEASADLFGDSGVTESDPLYDEAVAFVIRTRRASISSVQRQLRIGYNRAARLVEQMETAGLLSPMASNGSREILVPPSSN
jgi:DNA segregation ATPase FtsK/SpoIIIE, S-DNA-T family